MTSATDNRTTELRDKLDALNIEHFDYDKGGRTQTQWEAPDGKRHFTYETSNNPAKTARLVIAWHPTPEQAIAATLGGANVDDALALLDEMNEQGRIEYADYSQLHDAIAATLGNYHGYEQAAIEAWESIKAWNARAERTCTMTLDGTDGMFGCSECYENIPPLSNYCPNCGKAVK